MATRSQRGQAPAAIQVGQWGWTVLGAGHPERKGDQHGGGVMRESAFEATQKLMFGSSCFGRSGMARARPA
jgi:hypothetical protein